MQTVLAVVLRKLYLLALKRELALVYAVGVTADCSSEVAGSMLGVGIIENVVETENHVLHVAVLVGNHNGNDAPAEVGYANLHAIGILQRVEGCFLSVNG